MTDRLVGKVALVTGGASGLGREVVDLFSAEGAAVVMFDVDGDRTDLAAQKFSERGRRVLPFVGNVTEPDHFDRAIDYCQAEFGGFDVIHNNAAVQLEKPLHQTTDEDYHWLVDVNIRGVFNGCRAAVRSFLERGEGGCIINTTSISAHAGASSLALYSASKAALLGMTYSIASGYAVNKIRANCVSPGDMETPMLQKYLDATGDPVAARSELLHLYPAKSIAHPREIGQVVLFLATDEASSINGQCIIADGGLLTSLH